MSIRRSRSLERLPEWCPAVTVAAMNYPLRLVVAAIAVVTGLSLIGTPAQGQARLLVGVGVSSPNGEFAERADLGRHGRAGIQVGVPAFPLSFRADGEYHRLPEDAGAGTATDGSYTVMVAGTASAVFTLGIGVGPSVYVLGGLGRYRTDTSDSGEPDTDSGIHAAGGVGFGLLGLGLFAEARVVRISKGQDESNRMVLLTLGARF